MLYTHNNDNDNEERHIKKYNESNLIHAMRLTMMIYVLYFSVNEFVMMKKIFVWCQIVERKISVFILMKFGLLEIFKRI